MTLFTPTFTMTHCSHPLFTMTHCSHPLFTMTLFTPTFYNDILFTSTFYNETLLFALTSVLFSSSYLCEWSLMKDKGKNIHLFYLHGVALTMFTTYLVGGGRMARNKSLDSCYGMAIYFLQYC